MASPKIVSNGYSYEPPSYEEAQANESLKHSVYNPTVSQGTTVIGFQPSYTQNGYNVLTECNDAKRRRKMRIAGATIIGVLGFIIFIVIVISRISLNQRHNVSQTYKSSSYNDNENLTPYSYNKDYSSGYNNNNYRQPTYDDQYIQSSFNHAVDKTEVTENSNNANNNDWEPAVRGIWAQMKLEDFHDDSPIPNSGSVFDDIDAVMKKQFEKLNSRQASSSSENPTSTTETVTPTMLFSVKPAITSSSTTENPLYGFSDENLKKAVDALLRSHGMKK